MPTRTVTYRWWSGLFLEPPSRDQLAAYRSAEGREFLESMSREPGLLKAVTALRAIADRAATDEAAVLSLTAAFNRVFLEGAARSALPYASVWLSENGLFAQQPTREMARLLRDAGLVLNDALREMPDHIAIQLNLMAELVEREKVGLPTPVASDEFLRRHLLSWTLPFATRIEAMPDPGPYAVFARALCRFLHADLAAIAAQCPSTVAVVSKTNSSPSIPEEKTYVRP
jgi:TorA specific chaperone